MTITSDPAGNCTAVPAGIMVAGQARERRWD
jgi:hypothetical protein